ncbi:MAG: PD-(D/E)XK nuclease family protein, partial [Bacillota bacterium]|nr:PD-(D/E)XK nuclease family protein [Bacillota bacterium]
NEPPILIEEKDKLDGRILTIGGGEGLFNMTKYIIELLADMAKATGETYEVLDINNAWNIDDGEEDSRLRKSIWTSNPGDRIKLAVSSNVYSEADRIALYIQELVRDRGYKYGDITIICNEMEERGGILLRTFDRWGIPAFADKKRRVLHQPVIRFLLGFLDLISRGYNSESILKMVSTGFLGLSREDEELLGNYVVEGKIGKSRWKKPFVWKDKRGSNSRYTEEELNRLNEIREFIVTFVESAKDDIGRRNKTKDKVLGLYEFLKARFCIEERVEDLLQEQENIGHVQEELGRKQLAINFEEGARETAQIWNRICELFEQITQTIGEERIRNEQLKDIIAAGLEEMEIGLVPTSKDCVLVGTMQRTRISHTKCLIIAAANEGILPLATSDSGLLSDRELETLENLKLSISKRDMVRQQEEQLAIYRLFSLPEDELFVSCSLADLNGGTLMPSGLFDILEEINGGNVMGDLDKEEIIGLIGSNKGTLNYMAEAMRKYIETGSMEDEWVAALNWYCAKDPKNLHRVHMGMEFDNQKEKLGQELAEGLYFGDEDKIRVSASRLETYASCPFKYFIDKGLKAEEARKYEIDARSRGDVYHEALQFLAKSLIPRDGSSVTGANSLWMKITRDECKAEIARIVTELAQNYREGIYLSDNSSRYQLERVIDNCGDMAWAMIEQVRKSRTKSMYLEEPFNERSNILKPIEINLSNGKKAILNGRIDRVDVLETESHNEVGQVEMADKIRVIDYKTGNPAIDIEQMRVGYKLQLMVYINAANGEGCEEDLGTENASSNNLNSAGAFYFKINELDIDDDSSSNSSRNKTLEEKMIEACRLEGVFVNDKGLIDAMDTTLEDQDEGKAKSSVIPIKMGKEGYETYSSSALLTREEFKELCEASREQVKEICQKIQSGEIDIAPKRERKPTPDGGRFSACTYCQYRSICLFDTSFRNCRYTNV